MKPSLIHLGPCGVALALILSLTAAAQALPAPAAREVSYGSDIHPLLAERCYSCHGGDDRRGGLSMNTREALLEGGETGPVVDVGDSANSLLIELVTAEDPDVRMPNEGPPLTAEQIGLLRAWIDQGLQWDAAEPVAEGWTAPIVPRKPEVPNHEGIGGSRHPIDRFIQQYWREREIDEGSIVDDATFARRTYLGAIGLLPTTEELEGFLADGKPDKRSRLVRRLLQRDRDYAEHWMTFWNDALRNDFQGTGYIDGGRQPITQWLYDALYYNKPYDQFVRELIHPSAGSRGFVDGIVWRGVTAAAQRPPIQAARSVSQVFLGVNLKCASCHDSFIDEWKLADSYGLANSFSDEPLELVRCDQPTGRIAETKFLWPELGEIDGDAPKGVRMRQLADIVTGPQNGRFRRTIANRIWAKLMGRGLVEPLDAMGRRPWHPDLLDWLAWEFAAMDHDLRALIELIMTSHAYQLESVATAPDVEEYRFIGPDVKRLSAEMFYDALSRVTGLWQQDPKFSPPREHPAGPGVGVRAWRIPSDALTRALGRPNREQVVTRREQAFTTLQALEMTNGEVLTDYLQRSTKQLHQTLPKAPESKATILYRRALQRSPTPEESRLLTELMTKRAGPEGLADALWAVAMLPEFQLIY